MTRPVVKDAGAWFSPDRVYRYLLWREFDQGDGELLFILLNPSTADAYTNDPTLERCQRRAISGGYRVLFVANLFALRATNPADLRGHHDPVGPQNDEAIGDSVHLADRIVCGWGAHGRTHGRDRQVLDLLNRRRREWTSVCHLGLTKHGQPKHPLYIPYATEPQRWELGA